MRINLLIYMFIVAVSLPATGFAKTREFTRDYIYHAGEADSKISSRKNAVMEIKRELLNELGSHVVSLVKLEKDSSGKNIGTQDVELITAGITRLTILEERWDGKVYYIKASLRADPDEVLRSIKALHEERNYKFQAQQAKKELALSREEIKRQLAVLKEALEQRDRAAKEMQLMKAELEKTRSNAEKEKIQERYENRLGVVDNNDLFLLGLGAWKNGDLKTAYTRFLQAAQSGHSGAQIYIGNMYHSGRGVKSDPFKAEQWYKKAVGRGSVAAMYELYVLYGYYNAGNKPKIKDNSKAVKWLRKAANAGYADAQRSLADAFYFGYFDISRDESTAMTWYLKAAQAGDATAQWNLAERLAKRDPEQAVRWYREVADKGWPSAQYQLGLALYQGNGVAKNHPRAYRWLLESARQGYVEAQVKVGDMYLRGDGVAKNAVQAFQWLEKAADKEYDVALFKLAAMYEQGNGVVKDVEKARRLKRKADEIKKRNEALLKSLVR